MTFMFFGTFQTRQYGHPFFKFEKACKRRIPAIMSEADNVSLLPEDSDSDEDGGDTFGTPEGEFACRLSAASAPDDDCVYGWVVRARVHPCVRVCAPICGGQGTTRGVRVTCA